eukprot:753837-Amphidinium_carterae.1
MTEVSKHSVLVQEAGSKRRGHAYIQQQPSRKSSSVNNREMLREKHVAWDWSPLLQEYYAIILRSPQNKKGNNQRPDSSLMRKLFGGIKRACCYV